MGIDDFLAEKPKYKSRKKLFLKAGWIRRKTTKIYRKPPKFIRSYENYVYLCSEKV